MEQTKQFLSNKNLKIVKKFYIKLYLHQYKDKTFNSSTSKKIKAIREATQSWHSLSEEDIQIFIEQYKKHGMECKVKIANYLKNNPNTIIKKNCKSLVREVPDSFQEENNLKAIEHTSNLDIFVNLEHGHNSQQSLTEIPDTNIRRKPSIPRPDPPAAIKPKQFYNLINGSRDDVPPWDVLPTIEKKRYQDALYKLKKDYLKKYESYLHDLSSEELYYHMIEILNSHL